MAAGETVIMLIETTETTRIAAQPEFLNRKQITESLAQIGATEPMIRRYAVAPGIAELVGAFSVNGQKGPRYPLWSLTRFRKLVHLQVSKLLTPMKAAEVLRKTPPEEYEALWSSNAAFLNDGDHSVIDMGHSVANIVPSDVVLAVNGNVNQVQLQNAQTMHLVLTLMQDLMARSDSRQIAGTSYPVVDHAAPLLTRTQAAQELCCSPDKVSSYVPSLRGRRSVFARADINAYIEGHRALA